MAGPKTDDLYGSFGSVPTVTPEGGGGQMSSVRSNANDFGGQVGEALQKAGAAGVKLGGEALDTATHFSQMATEAKVNDDYANKYTPAATQLRSQFDNLRGQDKIHGYEGYVKNLQELNKQFVESAKTPYEKQLIGGQINRHVASEISGASRELVQSQKEFSDQSTYDSIKASSGYAASNYNNPEIVASIMEQNDSHITKQAIDNGIDPVTEHGQAQIGEAQRQAKAQTVDMMINRALASGDVSYANTIRSDYGMFLPGDKQRQVDSILHVENIRQTAQTSVTALKSGQPLPNPVGAPAAHVQAVVLDKASTAGLDQNHVLGVLRLESSNGQNLGKNPNRMSIGQDKESSGKPLDVQAQALCDNLQKAASINQTKLGRQPELWENYVTYNQGEGGGPALLNAVANNPNALAVDVLAPLYKTRGAALSAVMNNGGNATMTSSDFVDGLHKMYDDNVRRASCDPTTGEALVVAHQTTTPAVQPGVTPMQNLLNFEKRAPDMLTRINAIPNIEVRDGVMHAYQRDHEVYSQAASAYKGQLVNQASQLAVDPTFTSPDQIPSDVRAALTTDAPQTLEFLQKRADYNLKNTQNIVSQDKANLGDGFYSVLDKVYAPVGSPEGITSIQELQEKANSGEITMTGYDALSKEIGKKSTPAGQAELQAKQRLMAYGKSQISGSNAGLFIHDPKGEQLFTQWMALTMANYDKGIESGKTSAQLLTPSSTDYLGKTVGTFQRSLAQMTNDMVSGSSSDIPSQYLGNQIRTVMDVAKDLDANKITRKQAEEEFARLKKAKIPDTKSVEIASPIKVAAEIQNPESNVNQKPQVPNAQ